MSGEQTRFGTLLKRYRTAAGLTQEALAARAQLSARAISDLERGINRVPHHDTLELLMAALNVTTPQRALLLSSGVGKTRLGIELAQELGERFEDGVIFVALAPLRDPSLLPATLAQALGLREHTFDTVAEVVQSSLQEQQLLLVLDNFEHIRQAAPFIATLLATCPRLQVLVTSRTPHPCTRGAGIGHRSPGVGGSCHALSCACAGGTARARLRLVLLREGAQALPER